jgi:chromosome segregation ATPase
VSGFEEANFALQNRLDIADRKIQVHETAIRSLTQERDSAVLQLGIAYLNSQDLKLEYETLKTENAELRAQLEKLNGFTQDLPEEPESRQVTRQTQSDVDAMVDSESETNRQHYTQRSLASSRRQGEISTKKTQDKRLQTEFQSNSHTRISNQIDKEMSRIEMSRIEKQDETLFSFDIYPGRSSMSRSAKSNGNAISEANMDKKQPNTSKQRTKRVIVGDHDESENVDMDDVVTEDGANETGKDQDLTLLSFIDVSDLTINMFLVNLANELRVMK